MFYAHFVLSKKGPLARIWLAAHWDKKLSKAQIFETSIEGSVEAIMQPQVKLALRTSGHLLLGVVRIYSRKANYLLTDCSAAIVKIKMAFRPGAVDLPEEGREAAVTAVTLPENFYEFDTFFPSVPDLDLQSRFAVHQSQPEAITLREHCHTAPFIADDSFGDIGFDDIVLPEPHNELLGLYARSVREPEPQADMEHLSPSVSDSSRVGEAPDRADGEVAMDVDAGDVAESEQQRHGKSPEPSRLLLSTTVLEAGPDGNDVYNYDGFGADESVNIANEFGGHIDAQLFGEVGDDELFADPVVPPSTSKLPVVAETGAPSVEDQTVAPDQTTIIANDAEAFALGPIDATNIGTGRKLKKKRKLIIDDQKLISSETMRGQLRRAGDLIISLDLAPPTKRLMQWKQVGGVDKLLSLSGKHMDPARLRQLYQRCLVTHAVGDNEDTDRLRKRKDSDVEQECATVAAEPLHEVRRGASLSGVEVEAAGNLSRLSTAMVAAENVSGVQATDDIHGLAPDASLTSAVVDASVVSLLPVLDIAMPAAIDDLSFNAASPFPEPSSVLAPPAPDDLGDDTAFNETLQSAATDITLFAEGENEEDVQILNRRSGQLLHAVQKALGRRDEVPFSSLVSRNHRKQVAAKFHTLLVLKKLAAVHVQQKSCFGKIAISRGPAFNTIVLQ